MPTTTGSARISIGNINVAATGNVIGTIIGNCYINLGNLSINVTGHITLHGTGHIQLGEIDVDATGIRIVIGRGQVTIGPLTMAATHIPLSITYAHSLSVTDAEGNLTKAAIITSAHASASVTAATGALTWNLHIPPGADTGASVEAQSIPSIRAALLSHYLDTYVVPDAKHWELENERFRHDQALFRFGEYSIFVTMWTMQDFTAGLVGRCPTCYVPQGALEGTWQQPAYFKCPDCLGTSFQGGYKAILVRPSLWSWNEPTLQQTQRGVINTNVAQVQTTSDFRLQPRDYIIRGDGSRWQSQEVTGDHLDTGFGTQSGIWNATAFIYANVTREDESSPIYLLPITEDYIQETIPKYYSREPVGDF
jgi:hypothetical protein